MAENCSHPLLKDLVFDLWDPYNAEFAYRVIPKPCVL